MAGVETKTIGLVDLARAFNMSAKQLERELALLGWGVLMNEAERLAHLNSFGSKTALGRPQLTWECVTAATESLMPHLVGRTQKLPKTLAASKAGYVYVLHDGVTGLSKIGCTSKPGVRQRAIMGAHGSVLVNVLNARVPDMRAAEARCHRHFDATRQNGEWFSAQLESIIEFIGTELDASELDMEVLSRLGPYLLACRQGDMKAAKRALLPSMPPWPDQSTLPRP